MTASLQIVGTICRRTWQKTARRPVVLTFSFLQPILWILLFGFLFHRYDVGQADRGVRYLDFLVPGVCAMTVLFGASQSGIGLIRDMQTGFLSRMLRTPADPALVLTGKILADVLRLQAQAFLILLIGWILGAKLQFSPAAVVAILLALGMFAVSLSSVSCLIALKTGAQESMAAFVHLVNMPLLFTSTALAPSRQMPDWLASIARFNPLTLAVDAGRDALLFGEFTLLPRALGWLLLLAIILFAAAGAAMRKYGRQTNQ
jgi:ABC-2 type transport system permease protein